MNPNTRTNDPALAEPIAYTQRLRDLATADGHTTAIVFVSPDGAESKLTNAELYVRSLRTARLLQSRGVGSQSLVGIALGNTADAVVVAFAAWWCGACVMPLSHRLPDTELDQVLEAAVESGRRLFVAGDLTTGRAKVIPRADLATANSMSSEPLPVVIPNPGRAIPSGGSTGRPKLITDGGPMVALADVVSPMSQLFGSRLRQSILILGPIYHTGPFGSLFGGLFNAGCVVLMEQFDPELALRLVERHRIKRIWTVPVQLLRMARVPGVDDADLSSVESLYHSGAACPAWLKRRWIELVGPEHVYEGFGSSESVGALIIRGDEWLKHPGSVGRPQITDIRIRNADGALCEPHEVGEIFMRWAQSPGGAPPPVYTYWGSPPAKTDGDGCVSVGDLAWQDEEGYVYIADRRVDMIITGGVNVYPAEVEATLTEIEAVRDVAVVGVPDDEWGRRVHAIIETERPSDELVAELDRHCRTSMAPPKVPKSYEFLAALPRNDAGKIRRAALAADREAGWSDSMVRPPREGH